MVVVVAVILGNENNMNEKPLSCKHNMTYSFRFGEFVFTLDSLLW